MTGDVWRIVRALQWRCEDRLPAVAYRALASATTTARRRVAPWMSSAVFAIDHGSGAGRIHLDDTMLGWPAPAAFAHYDRVGREAGAILVDLLARVGRDPSDVRRVLDFPSGYGRVTRDLRRRFPHAVVHAADVDPEAVRFCVEELGAIGHVTGTNMARLGFPHRFDLVFVGSLLTHLTEDACATTLRVLVEHLEAGGMLVFTTHGESCLAHVAVYGHDIAQHADALAAEVAARGIAYRRYAAAVEEYGITIHARAYVEALLREQPPFSTDVEIVAAEPRRWDGHQDVWAVRRRSA